MENRMKKMFRSSFGSCRRRNLPVDTVEKAIFQTHKDLLRPIIINDHDHSSLPKPLLKPFPSICKQVLNDNYTIIPKHKISNRYFDSAPPISPLFPEYIGFGSKPGNKLPGQTRKTNNKKKKNKRRELSSYYLFSNSSSSLDTTYFDDWWLTTSDEDSGTGKEDETETLFSSKSISSSSSSKKVGGVSKVKDSFAVVKSSKDPYNDFRTSMVEMIMEKQIFGVKELEDLLQCFLNLNADRHHRIIVEVFTEIWEALFSDWF
ncbi:hypothetical protein ACFE04_016790 [Oxalis oulophora]